MINREGAQEYLAGSHTRQPRPRGAPATDRRRRTRHMPQHAPARPHRAARARTEAMPRTDVRRRVVDVANHFSGVARVPHRSVRMPHRPSALHKQQQARRQRHAARIWPTARHSHRRPLTVPGNTSEHRKSSRQVMVTQTRIFRRCRGRPRPASSGNHRHVPASICTLHRVNSPCL